MTKNDFGLSNTLSASGYEQKQQGQRNVFEKRADGFLSRAIYTSGSNTVYLYECTETGSPISFVEFHNIGNERQLNRLDALLV